MKTYVYLDNAASTPTAPEVFQAMMPYLKDDFANPSSRHSQGRAVNEKIEQARRTIAEHINAKPEEIYFTGSGTESNNLAIQGVVKANQARGKHIISTRIEHPSIINTLSNLETAGWEVTYLEVDGNGQINLDELENKLRKDTVLVTLAYGNNEIGTIFPIAKVAELAKKNGTLLHVDACQSLAYLPIDVRKSGIDLLTFNGSKCYGTKGIAVLYVRESVDIFPVIYGGGQEKSLRSGTHNVAGIVGLAKACELIKKNPDMIYHISELRDYLQVELEKVTGIQINCKNTERLPNHLSVTFTDIENTDLVAKFDEDGIELSSGSACSSASLTDSHVLQAIGLSSDEIQATVRITLGRDTSREDCDRVIALVKTFR